MVNDALFLLGFTGYFHCSLEDNNCVDLSKCIWEGSLYLFHGL